MASHVKKISLFGRIKRFFHAKNIVVVSQHAVDHYSISLRSQCMIVVAALGVVAAASFSTGRYINARQVIAEKNETLEVTKAENDKIVGEFSLLKKDLIKMNEEGEGLSDYAQFVLDQYQQPDGTKTIEVDSALNPTNSGNSSTLLERVDFLERQLEREVLDKQQFMNTIHQLTRDKVRVLEEALKMTGMNDQLSSVIDKNIRAALPKDTRAILQGGPFSPYNGDATDEELERSLIAEIAYLAEISEMVNRLPLARPMKGARLTSGFGKRVDPFRRRLANHHGLDYAGKWGSKIYATAPGKVIYAGYRGAYGKTIEIDHGNGFTTRYSHLSRIKYKKGVTVETGQEIGTQGTTGRSTGHHLHYEVRYKGKAINPAKFVKAGQHVSKSKQEG